MILSKLFKLLQVFYSELWEMPSSGPGTLEYYGAVNSNNNFLLEIADVGSSRHCCCRQERGGQLGNGANAAGAHMVSAHVGGCLERDVSQFSIHPCAKIH